MIPGMISVVVPVYNNARYLSEALDSIRDQSFRPLDVIAVDDGSTDGSARIIESHAPFVRCVSQPNEGVGSARNRGLRLARGEYLAFLDADDRMLPECLERLHAELDSRPELDMVFAHVTEFLSPELRDRQDLPIRPPFQRIPGRMPTNMLIRREAFRRVGEFSIDRRTAETLDWYARAMHAGLNHMMMPEVLWERRLHEYNAGLQLDYRAMLPQMLKQALDRTRRVS